MYALVKHRNVVTSKLIMVRLLQGTNTVNRLSGVRS